MLTEFLLLLAMLLPHVHSAPPQARADLNYKTPAAPGTTVAIVKSRVTSPIAGNPTNKRTTVTIINTTVKTYTGVVSSTPLQSNSSSKLTAITSPSPAITAVPGLSCTGGSTVKTTTECTYGHTYSYCHSEPPPLTCPPKFYSSTINYGHCQVGTTCFPVDAPYLTTICPPRGGQTAYSMRTVYSGVLAGGKSTIIRQVQCQCATDFYYSWNYGEVYCMPRTSCGEGMTTSFSTNTYCATVTTPSYCDTEPHSYAFCACKTGIPVYPPGGASPTACV